MSASNTPTTRTFGQVIRQRRIELGLTQEALAERVGDNVRQADISRLERDYISMPRRSRLEALAKALDVSPGYLLMQSGWFLGDDALPESADESTPQPVTAHAMPEPDAPGTSRGDDIWYAEPGPAANSLHEAILRARELSSQTRDVLSESADTMRRAGQTRRRRE